MHKYFIRQFIVVFLSFTVLTVLNAQSSKPGADGDGLPPNSYMIHGEDMLRDREVEARKLISQHPEVLKSSALRKAWSFNLNDTKAWYADNFITNNNSDRYQVPSTCRAVGTNCYIFVEDSSWIKGRVTQTAVDSVRIYFDSKTPANPSKGIFETDTSAFGNPKDVDGDPRIVILLLDIKDGYNGSGGYVGGYFYSFNEFDPSVPGYSTSNFAEMFFIDTYPLNLTTIAGLKSGTSILAHEFQHMIHYNYDPNEITFVDEGCALVAEVNCGFPIYNQTPYINEPNHYLLDWRGTDNVKVLNDYSRAARFFVYLRDQAGIGVFKKIVTNKNLQSVPGINAGLAGTGLNFLGIMQSWFVANQLNDRSVDPSYGYIYPNLPKPVEKIFYNPNVALTNDSVNNFAVQYLVFKAGSQLHITFTSSSSSLVIKAIEIGPSAKRVLDVIRNTEFTDSLFGTTYNEIHFVVMNTNLTLKAKYSYTATGTGGIDQTTISYAGDQGGYMVLPDLNKKLAVRFSPAVSGQLNSVSVELNSGEDAIQGNGQLRVSACQNIAGSIGGIPDTIIGSSVDVPFSQLISGSWNDINMQGANVPITAGTDFHIVIEVNGTAGDILEIMLDDGKSPTDRSSSYRNGLNGLGWYNRADSSYGSGKAVSYENLFITASIGAPTSVENTTAQTKVPLQYGLEQNYPNPFNPSTTISFKMPSKGFATLKVYDMIGREVRTLVSGLQEAGTHDVKFDASNLPSGVYFYRINTGAFAETKKLVLIK